MQPHSSITTNSITITLYITINTTLRCTAAVTISINLGAATETQSRSNNCVDHCCYHAHNQRRGREGRRKMIKRGENDERTGRRILGSEKGREKERGTMRPEKGERERKGEEK